LNERLIKFLRFFGMNRAIGYGVLARAWSLISGPITILVIASRFSKEQQGFYYTISSLLALQIFFELGLVSVLAQFVSHEFAHLSWGPRGQIEGEPAARERLLDLLCKAVRWFGVVALLLVLILVPVGLLFLNQQQGTAIGFSWRLPWFLAVCGTALNLMIVPFFAVVTGSGDVVTVNHREMLGALVSSFICWTVIGLYGGLFAVFAITTGTFIVSAYYLIKKKPELLRIAWNGVLGPSRNVPRTHTVSWSGEIWPMQWKIALSWVSGYFLFQLFTPTLFHFYGPKVAGQMGMTLSVSNALLAGCSTWMNARAPLFGMMIARKEWRELDALFWRVMLQSIIVAILGAITGYTVIHYLQVNYQIGQRFIPANHAALLFGAIVVQVVINCFAVYLRAHKKEPLMWLSIIGATIQGVAVWYFGKHYASLGVTSVFLTVNGLFGLPTALLIWQRCRKLWHSSHA